MKAIAGFEGLYSITEDGRVWSHPKEWISGKNRRCKHEGKFLSGCNRGNGYIVVGLSKERIRRIFYVHILVAQTFIPNPQTLTEINHKNSLKWDNRLENLEWCTHQQNIKHMWLSRNLKKRK